jgi:galactose mutarotase-like enzyme
VQHKGSDGVAKEMTLNYTPFREPGNFRNDDKNIYFGVTNGRVAGRIAKGKFDLPDGSSY